MPETTRPNPDRLLAEQPTSETPAKLGRLKVFFGAAPGVGKTYAMLEEARARAAEGVDVLVGYAEPHIRAETELLLIGLDIQKPKLVDYRGRTLKEFDLEAALQRRPHLICVDELAHTNAPGLRHEKRWQDVFELLEAGIDVFTTLNVQHLESVKDIVESITGVEVRETLPDEVLDRADEIELIDTTPDELTKRLVEGKVYRPDIAERAIRQFFNKGNLTALRELALRRTAERVDAQMLEHRQRARVRQTWAASERIIVCVGPSPLSARLVRSARRLAVSLRAQWSAVFVETPQELAPDAKARVNTHLQLAQQLGGEAITLSGHSMAQTLTDYARERNVTKIIIGKPEIPRWRERLFGSLVDDVIRRSGDIDVYVIRSNEPADTRKSPPVQVRQRFGEGYAVALVVTSAATLIGLLFHRQLNFSEANVLMIYILSVVSAAWWSRRRAAVVASILSVLCFNYFFVEPIYTLTVAEPEYIVTLSVLLLTGLLVSALVRKTRSQAEMFRRRQNVTQAVLDFTAELGHANDTNSLAQVAAARIGRAFDCDCTVMLLNQNALQSAGVHGTAFCDNEKEQAVARWTADHREPAGRGTATLPNAAGLYVPIQGRSENTIGVIGLRSESGNPINSTEDQRLLDSLSRQAAIAIERAALAEDSREAWRRVQQEDLRNTLLAAVSHDLRTPLTAITGSASALVDKSIQLPEAARSELAANILSESQRMERVISNLLDITRLEAGEMPLRRELVHVGEIIDSVVHRLRGRLADRALNVRIDPNLPLAPADATAIDQVVTNLIENAIDHTPPQSPIDIEATADDREIAVSIADSGPGLAAGSEKRVFEKFARLSRNRDRRGLGLGLAICKAIIEAHGGTISAANRPGGGAVFRFSLPRGEMEQS